MPSTCHNHTNLCDGTNTPAEMAAAAFAAGFADFGFSGHSRTRHTAGKDYGVEDEAAYVAQLQTLRADYAGRMRIAIGMEQDFLFPVQNRAALDYIIGSVHEIYDPCANTYYWVDGTPECFQTCCRTVFGGDTLAMVRRFYEMTAENVRVYRPEVLGHFDLICKNNAENALFDETGAAYRSLALEALDACLQYDPVVEVNTGGMYRGYRTRPYPDAFLLRHLLARGARVTLNADAHAAAALTYAFQDMLMMLREMGFRELTVLENGTFVQKPL